MHRIAAIGRGPKGSSGIGIASLVFAAAVVLPGGIALAQDATPAGSPAGVSFASVHFPYTLELPPGWDVMAASQAPGSDEDQFQGDGASARVGGGPHEDAQQTVADRVASNRADETRSGSCTSDPSMDRATTLGGAEAILWSWTCPGSHHVAINTIHDGLRLRLQVNLPPDRSAEAEPLLEALRSTFRFTSPSEASPVPGDRARLDAALQGTWVTDWYPVELAIATLEAKGLEPHSDDPGWEEVLAATTLQHAIRFQDGEFTQYGALDGGPLEIGTIGTYRLLDDHTIEATETATLGTIQLGFTLRDDVLSMELLTELDPADMVALVGIFETLPFTRVP